MHSPPQEDVDGRMGSRRGRDCRGPEKGGGRGNSGSERKSVVQSGGIPGRHCCWYRRGNGLEGVGGGESGSRMVVRLGEVLRCIGETVGTVGIERGIVTIPYQQT